MNNQQLNQLIKRIDKGPCTRWVLVTICIIVIPNIVLLLIGCLLDDAKILFSAVVTSMLGLSCLILISFATNEKRPMEIEIPKYSPKGRNAHDVARAVQGLPFKADNQIIGEIERAYVDGFSVMIRVRFYRKFANEIKKENMPFSEQELPEYRDYELKIESWDRVFDASERLRLAKKGKIT
jgi:hypothetical protein